ncbi:ABC transporter permease [Butyrivibrio sp. MC2013]|uniref:ABC transporter permease n=1 Tax=Butyrivibrio sp. MC2013 TaxID=1280686 RepID=UPI000402396B|nr:ABC transporter permease [Butyrivibrio sp. MC2013]
MIKKKEKAAGERRLPGIGALPRWEGTLIFWAMALALGLVIVLHYNPGADPGVELIKKICACVLILLSCIVFAVFYDRIMVLPVELWDNRRLIWRMALNDFRKRYAGSYLGALWAFVQPVVTVVMYWFVFERIMGQKSQIAGRGLEVPYILFLMAGLVPWFYFQEGLSNGTTSLLEYSYLVKKVVFKISILPLIKIIGASFIHFFFVGLVIIVAWAAGFPPSIYDLQLFYYVFCLFMLMLALSYATSAIQVFFRDMIQIISIVLQVGQWATPILWNLDGVLDWQLQWIVKLNPMTYIVIGYRQAIYGETWFWEHFYSSTYFWIVVVALFGLGSLIFKRSKVHFADVL